MQAGDCNEIVLWIDKEIVFSKKYFNTMYSNVNSSDGMM